MLVVQFKFIIFINFIAVIINKAFVKIYSFIVTESSYFSLSNCNLNDMTQHFLSIYTFLYSQTNFQNIYFFILFFSI